MTTGWSGLEGMNQRAISKGQMTGPGKLKRLRKKKNGGKDYSKILKLSEYEIIVLIKEMEITGSKTG